MTGEIIVACSRALSKNNYDLVHAAFSGDAERVQRLLRQGMDPETYPGLAREMLEMGTPLIVAAYIGHADVANVLLDGGADIDAFTAHGQTALMLAAWRGNRGVVTTLTERGAALHETDGWGSTALGWAAYGGDAVIVQELVERGADVNGGAGLTALCQAARAGHEAIVRILLEHGASINLAVPTLGTPIMLAAQYGNGDVVQSLVAAGANIQERNEEGMTPLMLAAQSGNAVAVAILLDNGANCYAIDTLRRTVFHHAAPASRAPDVWGHLLAASSDLGEIPAGLNGVTPLMHWARRGDRKTLEILLQAGADPRATDDNGRTAINYSQPQVGDLLIPAESPD